MLKNFGALRAQSRNIKLRAAKMKNVVCVVVFLCFIVVHDGAFLNYILALHITSFSSCRNYWGGGQIDMFAPQYFHGGAAAQPPRIDASGGGGLVSSKLLCPPTKTQGPLVPPTEKS